MARSKKLEPPPLGIDPDGDRDEEARSDGGQAAAYPLASHVRWRSIEMAAAAARAASAGRRPGITGGKCGSEARIYGFMYEVGARPCFVGWRHARPRPVGGS